MAADPLRDSSSNVYNSHWKALALWANNKGILPNDLSFITLAEYLVELVALSRASHNLEFITLASGAKHVSIRMVPKFIPKNQRPEIIPEPIKFPGMAHLFPNEPERLLCPVRALGLYIVKSADRAQNDPLEKLFVHFNPETQLFTTHFHRWVAETIRLTYENSSQSDLLKIKAHESPHP